MAKEITAKDLVEADSELNMNEISFEKGLKLLEELVTGVEGGNLPLEKSIKAYEKGSQLMNHLKGLLEGAEQKLKLLEQGKKADL